MPEKPGFAGRPLPRPSALLCCCPHLRIFFSPRTREAKGKCSDRTVNITATCGAAKTISQTFFFLFVAREPQISCPRFGLYRRSELMRNQCANSMITCSYLSRVQARQLLRCPSLLLAGAYQQSIKKKSYDLRLESCMNIILDHSYCVISPRLIH